jgi:branched-chain amino acid transport system permease protein
MTAKVPLPYSRLLSSVFRKHRNVTIGLIVFAGVGSLAPLGAGKYAIDSVFDLFLLYVIIAESYDILGGMMGYVNLGITVFFGVGAYTYAILFDVIHWNQAGGLFVAALFSAFLGLLVSYPMFRLRGFYFAVATLALVPLGYYIVESPNLQRWTNGVGGINFVPVGYTEAYYAILAFAVLSILIAYAISRSRLGLALSSIREDEEIAEASGINTRRMKRIAMVISATMVGFAGALFGWSQGTVLPDSVFSLSFAFIPVTFAMFGGTGTIFGPIAGSAVYIILDATLHSTFITANTSVQWLSYYEAAIEGIFLLIVGLFAPDGIIGLARRLYRALTSGEKISQELTRGARKQVAR